MKMTWLAFLCWLGGVATINSFGFQRQWGIRASRSSERSLYLQKSSIGVESQKGTVYLVGSGPGDPDLLTVQAVKLLQSASLVVSDRLVSKEILSLIKCELKVANKRPGCADEAQDEINRWVIDAASEGRDVVRLKIGDPFLFGRGGEEILEYRKHGIESKVLPGLSSSYTAPLAATIPLTHRGVANQVLISTGFGRNATYIDLPRYNSECTVVLLMAVGRIDEIATSLVAEKGFPGSTPVCIVEKATTPDERFIHGNLQTIAAIAKAMEAKPPATIIIGDVVQCLQPSQHLAAVA